jgi:K+ transporter
VLICWVSSGAHLDLPAQLAHVEGLPRWEEVIFAAMERNAAQVTDFFRLPVDMVVEIGRQVAI